MHKSAYVANSFLYKAKSEGVNNMDQLKVQKLVYCLHGWHLAVYGTPAVGEFFEAWKFGPVLSSLYDQFKMYGSGNIDSFAVALDPISGEPKALYIGDLHPNFHSILEPVWNRYKHLTGLQLSALTHAPGTPWSIARAAGESYITNEAIRLEFVELAKKSRVEQNVG